MMKETKPLIGLTLEGLRQVAAQCGMPKFAAGQMARWLYEKRVTAIEEMTDLSKGARQRLAEEGYIIGREAPLGEARSSDGTVKYLFRGYRRTRRGKCLHPRQGTRHPVRILPGGMQDELLVLHDRAAGVPRQPHRSADNQPGAFHSRKRIAYKHRVHGDGRTARQSPCRA